MFDEISRRAMLRLGAGVAAASIAGCTDQGNDSTNDDSGTPTPDGEYMNGVGDDAAISFDVPSDGTTIHSPSLQWTASADGVTIEEAGQVNEGAGHYHIMIDTEPVTPGETIPSDDQHIHYGTGQSDGVLELGPGEHTLHLQVADGEHTAMGLTDSVDVTVEDTATLDVSTSVDGSVVDWEATAEDYTIEPSSNGVNSNSGHLHAIIDTDPVAVGEVIPSDARHVHYGDGSTSGTLDLEEQLGEEYEPGEYTIHFQVGSGTHRGTLVRTETTVTTS
ncbi:DUF4399 domain-containing protein [Natronomonas gomsonensis]|jgi:hypothetical protein|uniref:DUF4399 domain-containing protein n=1 Tax=Natronomonas gomsonensis TaxID=1046043 RepID=UPI0020CA9ABA|nr:DUF4399 domain-containing protein [Natronomonas gomsonensis]MCY4731176.1 DUF4399 domain-containing protein [Natronomonas gomsonensis]